VPVTCLTVQSLVQLAGRFVLLAVALFLSLLLVVLDGSTVPSQSLNWTVPLLVVVWGASAYLGHLRARWVRRRRVDPSPGSRRRIRRDEVVGGGAAAVSGTAAGVVAYGYAGAPVVPLISSVVLGAVVGLVASDILRRLGRSE
jgi:small-conductance mechanosensitive channel